MVDKYLNISELTEWLGVAKPTLWRWIQEGRFPSPTKLGRASRWKTSKVQLWIDEQEANAEAAKSAQVL